MGHFETAQFTQGIRLMKNIRMEAHALSIGYHSRSPRPPVASELNLTLRAGLLTCLIGPNGIGKSTLLRTLAGLQKPLDGRIWVDGVPVHQLSIEERARRISVVLTDAPHPGDLHVRQVVGLGRLPYTNWLGSLTEQDHQIIANALQQVNACALAGRSFGELSDGERQKVMIARALAQEPRVMILDEPTAFLDWPNRLDLLVTLRKIAHESGNAILISSHDLELALQVADELWVMSAQKGITSGKCRDLISQGLLQEVFSSPFGQFDSSKGIFTINL